MRRTKTREVRCRVTDTHTHRQTPSLRMRAVGISSLYGPPSAYTMHHTPCNPLVSRLHQLQYIGSEKNKRMRWRVAHNDHAINWGLIMAEAVWLLTVFFWLSLYGCILLCFGSTARGLGLGNKYSSVSQKIVSSKDLHYISSGMEVLFCMHRCICTSLTTGVAMLLYLQSHGASFFVHKPMAPHWYFHN